MNPEIGTGTFLFFWMVFLVGMVGRVWMVGVQSKASEKAPEPSVDPPRWVPVISPVGLVPGWEIAWERGVLSTLAGLVVYRLQAWHPQVGRVSFILCWQVNDNMTTERVDAHLRTSAEWRDRKREERER